MPLTLKRLSLVGQVAEAIRAQVLRGTWPDWIPSERVLSSTLHVSRNTCRSAIMGLRREGLVEPVQGRGLRVIRAGVRKIRSSTPHLQSVGIILPDAISRLRPSISLFVDEIRDELYDSKVRVHLHSGPHYYEKIPDRALEQLVKQNYHDCWILILSREPLQRWFAERKLTCLVSGSPHPGILLPSVDWDHRAICRHAADKLIALGHRRLAFFNRRSRAGGDLESEQGFMEAAKNPRYPDIEARVVYHEDQRESVVNLVQGLFALAHTPTGILVANSYCYLSIASALARRGLQIPKDVSLISRDDDSFLAYVDPEPARYLTDSHTWVRKIMYPLRQLLEGGATRLKPTRIMPAFIRGSSLRAI